MTAKAKGTSVTYTYPDGSKIVRTGTHPWRDRNPGDEGSGYGSIGRDAGGGNVMAIYPSDPAGWNSLEQNLNNKYGDSSIADTMTHFAGNTAKGDDPAKYAADLAAAVGVPVSTKISQLTPRQFVIIELQIAVQEGFFSPKNTETYIPPPK